ncbi:MAG: membrane protein insertase YidC [Thermoanaerobaculia bacterium]|nr:membrane protein insertase YidC [Thermoanaerobaculia bacterium]
MEKRLFIAVGLSLFFLWLYSLLVPKLFPDLAKKPAVPVTASASDTAATVPPAEASTPATAVPATTSAATPVIAPAATVVAESASAEETTTIDTPDVHAVFSNRGAQLVSFTLKSYPEKDGHPVELVRKEAPVGYRPFFIESSDRAMNELANHGLYVVTNGVDRGKGSLEYRISDARGRAIVKRFEFGERYRFSFRIETRGFDGSYRTMIGPGIHEIERTESGQFVVAGNGIVEQAGDIELIKKEKASRLMVLDEPATWIGVEDNYFLAALQPVRPGTGIFRRLDIPAKDEKTQPRQELLAGLNATNGVLEGKAFFGPKEADLLEGYGLESALHLGWFSPIARGLLYALVWIHGFTKNYGWAIVVLTIVIKLALFPLQHKSIVSMRKMQQVQPKVNALREKYKKAKTDPAQRQKLNEEMMKLYQVEGINPMSGCFPILLQLPILWAFYSLLSQAIELRGAEWILWITDLAAKDPYYLTPILMTITMVIQQKLTPTTVDPVQARVLMIMPFVFGFIFKDFPSGLVLYWLVQNVLSIIQQILTNRWWKTHPVETGK